MKTKRYIALLLPVILVFLPVLTTCEKENTTEKKRVLFFREDWKEIPAEIPVTQEHVDNPELILHLHGPSAHQIKKSHHDQPADDPYYIWSGRCEDLWAVSLEKKNAVADLSSDALIRWRTKQFGGRVLRVLLGLTDDNWLVSEQGSGTTADWTVFDVAVDTLTWRRLDIQDLSTGDMVFQPDLAKVMQIGFTDLMPGGQSEKCSRLDWIEVYGR